MEGHSQLANCVCGKTMALFKPWRYLVSKPPNLDVAKEARILCDVLITQRNDLATFVSPSIILILFLPPPTTQSDDCFVRETRVSVLQFPIFKFVKKNTCIFERYSNLLRIIEFTAKVINFSTRLQAYWYKLIHT